jgi:class 3 adenylate cyclase
MADRTLDHATAFSRTLRNATFVMDADGNLVFYNDTAGTLIGRPFDEVGPMLAAEWSARMRIRNRVHEPLPLEAMPGWIALQQNRPTVGFLRFTSLVGDERAVGVSATPLFGSDGFAGGLVQFWEEQDVEGERVTATALFCDLRGSTAMAATLDPTRVRDVIAVFYDEITTLVTNHGGTPISYGGDEVFAAWGVRGTTTGPDDAVACARTMQASASRINERLAAEKLPSVSFGIGAHTGEVIGAHVGFAAMRQYTILGDAVNCASRLCSMAGSNEIVVSSETYGLLHDAPPAEHLPGIHLKGAGRDLLPHRLWPDELKDPGGTRLGKVEPAS